MAPSSSALQPSDARRSGRPTSPMNSVSPVSTAYGASALNVGVVDQDRDRLRRVARRLEHLERERPELDRVAVAHRRERVVGLGAGSEVDRGAGAVAELEMAGHEVGVEVREEHMADPAAEPLGVLEVLLDVPLRVDDGRLATLLIGDQIRGVGEAAEVVLLEDQG